MPNRRAAAARLSQALSQGSVVAVVLFDIDHFKRINDTLGHSVGDQAIQRDGQTLLSCARDGDLVARWGGEELIGVLRGTSDGASHKLAERARIAVAALQTEAGPITISAGAAEGVAGTDPVKLAEEKLLLRRSVPGETEYAAHAIAAARAQPARPLFRHSSGCAQSSEQALRFTGLCQRGMSALSRFGFVIC